MEKERLVNTVADTLSVADVKRSGDALENVNSEQLTHKLTDTLEKCEMLARNTLGDGHIRNLVKTLAFRLEVR